MPKPYQTVQRRLRHDLQANSEPERNIPDETNGFCSLAAVFPFLRDIICVLLAPIGYVGLCAKGDKSSDSVS